LNVASIGLALDLARFTFFQIQVIDTLVGGPLFATNQFDSDTIDEFERIAVFPQNQSLELVNQTILQTAFQNHTAASSHSGSDSSRFDEDEQTGTSQTDQLYMYQSGSNHSDLSCFRIDGLPSMISHPRKPPNTKTLGVGADPSQLEKKGLRNEMV
jgi:hypothetical protein